MRVPVVDLSECILCGVCLEVCPAVFSLNDAGFVQVTELSIYPESEVDEIVFALTKLTDMLDVQDLEVT